MAKQKLQVHGIYHCLLCNSTSNIAALDRKPLITTKPAQEAITGVTQTEDDYSAIICGGRTEHFPNVIYLPCDLTDTTKQGHELHRLTLQGFATEPVGE